MFVNFEAFNEINASPVFSHAEVQQLREVLRENLKKLEESAKDLEIDGRYWKIREEFDLSNDSWKEHFKTRAKIKKLAALQTKLKSFDVLY